MRLNRRTLLGAGVTVGAGGALVGVGEMLGAAPAAAAPSIIGCDAWGAQPPTSPIVLLATAPVKIILHHTASPNSSDLSRAHAVSLARSIQESHLSRGWIDTGQHFTISRGGYVLEGRHRSVEALGGGTRQVESAHTTEQNQVAIGIENEGTYSTVVPPTALYNALVETCVAICTSFRLRPYQIYGHRDFQATSCPGDELAGRLDALRRAVAARFGGDPTPPAWPTLRVGASGERVRTLQYLLRVNAATITVDGRYGSATESAVRDFQRVCRSTVDGVSGRQVWNHLGDPVGDGARGEAVTALQRQLVARGIDVAVDGVYGPATASGVRTWQSRVGLPADGVVDARTWSRLVA